jgi:predicted HicB family RNase H-like nuclease
MEVTMPSKIITVRMPLELAKWLEKLAEKEHRSVNQQVIKMLDDARKEEAKPK